ncbi:MAG: hypothetical protein H6833_00035 [Planctomycetes bacterium]|nr:hypothetical protein [Planctomycetota bacterium]
MSLSSVVVLLAAAMLCRPTHAQQEMIDALNDARGTVRERAMQDLAKLHDDAQIVSVLDVAKDMRFEVVRRVAIALGRNTAALGVLARSLTRQDAGAALAARALEGHFEAHAIPLPSDPDAIEILPDEAFDLTGIHDLEDFCDATIASRVLTIPILLEPSICLDGGPATVPFPGDGCYPLRTILPPLDLGSGSAATFGSVVFTRLDTTVVPRGMLVRDERSARSVPSLFVRSLAYFTSPRAPLRLRQRAAVALGCLDLPTLDPWLAAEAAAAGENDELKGAATIALAVRFLRGSEEAWTADFARNALALLRVPGSPRTLLGAALRLRLERELETATPSAPFVTETGAPRLDDIAVAVVLAGIAPRSWTNVLDARLLSTEETEPRLLEAWLRSRARTSRALPATLRARLLGRVSDPSTDAGVLAAAIELLQPRPQRRERGGGASADDFEPLTLPTTNRWNDDTRVGDAWGRVLGRTGRIRDSLELLSRVDELGDGGRAMVSSCFRFGLSPRDYFEAAGTLKDRVREEVLAFVAIESRRSDSKGSETEFTQAFERIRERLETSTLATPDARRNLGRAFARALLGAAPEGTYRERSVANWLLELVRPERGTEAFEAAYRLLARHEPLVTRDIVTLLPQRRDLDTSLRMALPQIHSRVTNEVRRGLRLVDPRDPLRVPIGG